jgi:hypothetical protein
MEVAELVAKAGSSRSNQCEGYFYIGLRKLAERKRVEAKECFEKSYETGNSIPSGTTPALCAPRADLLS